MIPAQMEQMMNMAMNQAQKFTKTNTKVYWHVKVFDDLAEIEEFLNDGKNTISVNIVSHKEQIVMLYGTVK